MRRLKNFRETLVAEALGHSDQLAELKKSRKVLDMPSIESFVRRLGLHLAVLSKEKIRRAA